MGAIIDVKEGLLTFNIGGEKVEFNFNKAIKTHLLDEDCKALAIEPPPSRSEVESLLSDDPLGLLLT